MKKIIHIQEVPNNFAGVKKKIVVTGGCFDLLHIGHITLLENAKKEGDELVVFLESDVSIKKRKGIHRPIHTQEERAYMLAALEAVDVIILLPDEMLDADYDRLLQEIHPAVIAVTETDPSLSHKERQANLIGAKVVTVNKFIPNVSTTKLLSILSQEV